MTEMAQAEHASLEGADDLASSEAADPDLPAGQVAQQRSVQLWLPLQVGIASFLLGFPGGFGVAARNWHRLGRRALAWGFLLTAAVLMMAITFIDGITPNVAAALNVILTIGLFLVVRHQVRGFEAAGGRVEPGPGGTGLVTFIGGWFAVVAPTLALLTALTFIGAQSQAVLAGTVAFGTSAVACDIDSPATTIPANKPLYYAANLTREARAGETIRVTLSRSTGSELLADDLTLDESADCVSGGLRANALTSGTYVFQFFVGAERLASGEIVITSP